MRATWSGRTNLRFGAVVSVLVFAACFVVLSGRSSLTPANAQSAECASPDFFIAGATGTATLNERYRDQLRSEHGVPPVTFEIVEGALPVGLTMSSSGLIEGTPLVLGEFRFTVRGVDSATPPNCDEVEGTIEVGTGNPVLDDLDETLIDLVFRALRPGCLQSVIDTVLFGAPPNRDCL